jgi:hypothetical protein
MATGTGLGVVQGLDGMDLQPIRTVALRYVISLVILCRELDVDSSARMTVKAEGLVMAFRAIARTFDGKHPMSPVPVGVVVRSYPLTFVAFIAFLDRKG